MMLRSGLAAAALAFAGPALAAPLLSCGAGRDICERVCTPERIAYYYAGSEKRCTASCEPRYRACVATGFWVPLEREAVRASEAGR